MSITITSNAEQVASSLERKAGQLREAMTAKLNALTLALQRHIIADKLQGQALQQRDGSLAASIRVVPAIEQGGTITAAVVVEGSAEKYAVFQEFGTSGAYPIAPKGAKALHFLVGGKEVFTKEILHPPLKEHSFLRSGFDDMREDFLSGLGEALRQTLEAE